MRATIPHTHHLHTPPFSPAPVERDESAVRTGTARNAAGSTYVQDVEFAIPLRSAEASGPYPKRYLAHLLMTPGACGLTHVQELHKFPSVSDVEVFFSAHGVPKSYVEEAGDPYKEEMEECVKLIMAEVKARGYANSHTLAYQSRVGPAEWLKPYTDDSIR